MYKEKVKRPDFKSSFAPFYINPSLENHQFNSYESLILRFLKDLLSFPKIFKGSPRISKNHFINIKNLQEFPGNSMSSWGEFSQKIHTPDV